MSASDVFYLVIFLAAYFAPFIVAMARRLKHWGSVLVIDLFLGWTGVGWVVALAMACRTRERPPGPGTPA